MSAKKSNGSTAPGSPAVRIEFQYSPPMVSPPPPSAASTSGPSTSSSSPFKPPTLATSISQIESATSYNNDLYDATGDDEPDGCLTPDPEDGERKFRRGWAASPSNRSQIENSFQASTRSNESVLRNYRNEFSGRNRASRRTKTDAYKEEHPNRPSGALWKQQKLPAWQPILRPINVIGTFIGFGVLLLGIGIFMMVSTKKTKEIVHDYTNCKSRDFPNMTCAQVLEQRITAPGKSSCICVETITIPEAIVTPVYLYYSLDGFYQNHRRYVASISHDQLRGFILDKSSIIKQCDPFGTVGEKPDGAIYAPCGAIANSFFTDRFTLKFGSSVVSIKEKDIAWITDRKTRYHNPSNWDDTVKPLNWSESIKDLPGGYENEHLMVWMRTAAFPSFRKLWGRIEVESIWKDPNELKAGTYTVEIEYNYPTVLSKLNIPKKIIISNTSWLGGHNLFLPILYLVVGSLCVLIGSAFVFIVWKVKQNENKVRVQRPTQVKTNYQTMSSTDGVQFTAPSEVPASEN